MQLLDPVELVQRLNDRTHRHQHVRAVQVQQRRRLDHAEHPGIDRIEPLDEVFGSRHKNRCDRNRLHQFQFKQHIYQSICCGASLLEATKHFPDFNQYRGVARIIVEQRVAVVGGDTGIGLINA